MPTKSPNTEQQLKRSIDRLEKTISDLPRQYAAVFHPGKNLFMHFLRGVVYGFGMIVALALVIPFAILLIDQIQWVPLFGDFLSEVVSRMEQVRTFR